MIFQLPGERGYHVYYQILSGKKPELQGEGQNGGWVRFQRHCLDLIRPGPGMAVHSFCRGVGQDTFTLLEAHSLFVPTLFFLLLLIITKPSFVFYLLFRSNFC